MAAESTILSAPRGLRSSDLAVPAALMAVILFMLFPLPSMARAPRLVERNRRKSRVKRKSRVAGLPRSGRNVTTYANSLPGKGGG